MGKLSSEKGSNSPKATQTVSEGSAWSGGPNNEPLPSGRLRVEREGAPREGQEAGRQAELPLQGPRRAATRQASACAPQASLLSSLRV